MWEAIVSRGFDSRRGLRIFLCPMLVSCRTSYLYADHYSIIKNWGSKDALTDYTVAMVTSDVKKITTIYLLMIGHLFGIIFVLVTDKCL